jgi:hypothetical protein
MNQVIVIPPSNRSSWHLREAPARPRQNDLN